MEKSDFIAAFGRKIACISGRCAVAVWFGWQTLFQTKMFASKPSSGARFGRVNYALITDTYLVT